MSVFQALVFQKQRKKKLERKLEITGGLLFISSSFFLSNITGAVTGTSSNSNSTIGLTLIILAIVVTLLYLLLRMDKLKPK